MKKIGRLLEAITLALLVCGIGFLIGWGLAYNPRVGGIVLLVLLFLIVVYGFYKDTKQ